MLAVPTAMGALMAKLSPPENRGEAVGSAIGNAAGSLLGGPVAGIAGQIGGGMLLSNVFGSLGRQIDSARKSPSTDTVSE